MKVGAGPQMFTAKISWIFVQAFKKISRKMRVSSGLAATVVDVVHRICGGRRAVPRQWWSIWPEGHTRGMAPVVAQTKSKNSRLSLRLFSNVRDANRPRRRSALKHQQTNNSNLRLDFDGSAVSLRDSPCLYHGSTKTVSK